MNRERLLSVQFLGIFLSFFSQGVCKYIYKKIINKNNTAMEKSHLCMS